MEGGWELPGPGRAGPPALWPVFLPSSEEASASPASPLSAKRRVLSRSALRSHQPVARPVSMGLSRCVLGGRMGWMGCRWAPGLREQWTTQRVGALPPGTLRPLVASPGSWVRRSCGDRAGTERGQSGARGQSGHRAGRGDRADTERGAGTERTQSGAQGQSGDRAGTSSSWGQVRPAGSGCKQVETGGKRDLKAGTPAVGTGCRNLMQEDSCGDWHRPKQQSTRIWASGLMPSLVSIDAK